MDAVECSATRVGFDVTAAARHWVWLEDSTLHGVVVISRGCAN